jgi:uncharacterized protein (DUF1015 family)
LLPVAAGLVRSDVAAEVISPPYDLLSPSQRARHARSSRRSFLNGTPSEGDDPELDTAGRRRQANDYLERELAAATWSFQGEALFVLEIQSRGRAQTGVVGDVPVSAFPGLVRPHENTRPERVDDLASYLADVGYFSSPVGLTYRRHEEIDSTLDLIKETIPALDVALPDGDHHRVWRVTDQATIERLAGGFDDVPSYIIDGHHRVAASIRRGADPATSAGRFLAVAFPDDDLAIYPFHRWVDDSMPVAARVRGLTPSPGKTVAITREGEVEIDLHNELNEVDVAALSRVILGPVFKIDDERTDPRLAFVPGFPGPEALRARVEEKGGVGFLLAPTTVEAVIELADRGGVMPPKATFFSPKPRSGVFLVKR